MSDPCGADKLRKWVGNVRGNLLKSIRDKIENDPSAMYRVGVFLCSVGVSLDQANMFCLELAKKIAYLDTVAKVTRSKDGNLEQDIEFNPN